MIYIRTDSNSTISGGHIMRCLAIAKSIQKTEQRVCFLISDNNPSQMIEEIGFEYIVLGSDWSNLMTDVEEVKKLLRKSDNPLFLIDTYQVTKEYVDSLKPYCTIGYLGSKKEYLGELDFLINYSTDVDIEFYQNNYTNTTLMLGPRYAPLREEFQNYDRRYRSKINRILISTGNTDRYHMVDSLLECLLSKCQILDYVIDVVVGRMFDNKELLVEKYETNDYVFLHNNVKSMSELMKNCDLAISANGTTVYELFAMGLPTISFALVEEQVRSAESMSRLGIIDYCGQSYNDKDECVRAIAEKVDFYLTHNDEMISLAKKAHNLIDGKGGKRIAEILMELEKL